MSSEESTLDIFEAKTLEERDLFISILEESFKGWYLSHSERTLRSIEKVFGARLGGEVVGVVMLKFIEPTQGYVYYIAVSPKHRGLKIGGRLLEHSLSYFAERGANVVFASLTVEHGDESRRLFLSHGFVETNFGEISKRYGRLHAINMYRKMLVVSGEVVAYRDINQKLS